MTTATLRFATGLALDLAISKTTRPDLDRIFPEHRGIEHFARDIPIHDPEPVAREVIEIWDESEDFDPDLWDYEDFAPQKKPQNMGLLVLTNYGTRAV